jgi:hypothetical protein
MKSNGSSTARIEPSRNGRFASDSGDAKIQAIFEKINVRGKG